jgi:hypothetical protein
VDFKGLQHRNDGNGTIIEYQQDTSRTTQGGCPQMSKTVLQTVPKICQQAVKELPTVCSRNQQVFATKGNDTMKKTEVL